MRSPQTSLSQSRTLEDTNPQSLLENVPLDQSWDEGIPSLHIYTRLLGTVPELDPNQKLQIKVEWSSEKGGGRVIVDCPRGVSMTFGASQKSVTVVAQYVPIDLVPGRAALIPGRTLVQCVIGGIGSLSSEKPFVTSPRVSVAGGDSATFAIPEMARRGKILTDGTVAAGTTVLKIGTRDGFTTPIYQAPGGDWLEVVAGGLFFRMNNPGAATLLTAIWELSV